MGAIRVASSSEFKSESIFPSGGQCADGIVHDTRLPARDSCGGMIAIIHDSFAARERPVTTSPLRAVSGVLSAANGISVR